MRAHEEALASGPAPEDPVHDMRVATRRLRAALKVLGPQARERSVKRLQDALGAVRDLQVQRAWLERREGPRRAKPPPGLRALRAAQAQALPAAERQLARALRRWRERSVPRLLEALEALEDARPYAGRRALRDLDTRLRRVQRRARRYDAAPDARTAHRLRIAVKHLRYEAEVLRPALRRRMTALLEALVPLQEVLGALHDVDVRLAQLGALAVRAPPPVRRAARALLAGVQEERRACAAAAAREVQRWRTEQLGRALRRLLD